MEEKLELEQQVVVPEEKLYDLNTIMLATFLGGPMAGGYLLHRNYLQLGEEEGGKRIIRWAVFVTYALLGSMLLLPEQVMEKMPNFLVPWVSAGLAYLIAKKLQGEVITEHKELGGAFYTRWRAVWIGVVCALITLVMILPLVMLLPA